MDRVRKISESYPIFKQIEKLSGGQVKAKYSFIALASVIFALLFWKKVASPITNIFAIVLVLGQATGIIASKATPEISKVKHILSYLLTFSVFLTIDSVFPFVHRTMPFYYHVKLLFFYYLSIRNYQLTDYLNNTAYIHIHDTLCKMNEVDPKQAIKSAQNAATEKVMKAASSIKETVRPEKEE